VAAAGAILLFFRDPERPLDPDPQLVYAAADGRVTHVEETDEEWLPGGRGMRISTFLALYDVHVNRSPVGGEITRERELPGGFAPAFLGRSSEDNRRNRLAIEGPQGPAVVVQTAGMVARTISNWVGLGDRVATGQRLGLIHFGSRTDVVLPLEVADPLVGPGDRVRAGETPVARYRVQR
jgi:phosphatidylserine decarboxylase